MKVLVGIVLVLTLAFIFSAMSGVGKGIQYISNANMVLAAILAIFVFVFGPTVSILNMLPQCPWAATSTHSLKWHPVRPIWIAVIPQHG